jgi:hypothetical protein
MNWLKGLPPMSRAALAAGVLALAAAAAMNIVFGQTLAVTDKGQIIYSAASFVCAVAGTVVFGMMTGRLLREGRWRAAIMPFLLLCLATVWDVVSVMGFNATERLSAAAYRQEAIALAKDEQVLRRKYAEKLMGVATIRGNGISKSERREFMATASAEIGRVGAASAGPKLLPDALAELLSRYSGRAVEDIQLTLIVYMSILLVLIQSTGFTYAAYFDDRGGTASHPRDTASDGSGGGKKRLKLVSDADDDAADAGKKTPAKSAANQASTQRSAPSVNWTGASRRMSDDELREYLHQHASGQSQRQIAQATGWSQPSVSRKSRQVRRQEERLARKGARRDAINLNGVGGYAGMHHAPGIA